MIQGPASSTPAGDNPEIAVDSVREAYRTLLEAGLSEVEAGNLSAHLAGLAPVASPWRIREIERLLFIRTLIDTGRLVP